MAWRRILVGYDGSDAGRRALDRAVEEAKAHRARVTVLVVWNVPLDPEAPRTFGTAGDIAPWEGQPLDAPPEVMANLEAARDQLAGTGIRADLAWAAGTPARAIVDAAGAMRADVIVVGHHHHSLLGHLFGTDTAEELRREAGCEVVVA